MPAARYWRIIGIETYGGGDLELSEVALYDGATRVDDLATLTSTFAPVAGSLANLKDANTGTTARFAGADVFLPGFALVWDFGADQNVDTVAFGSPAQSLFIHNLILQYSTNGEVWQEHMRTWRPTKYPGANNLYTLPVYEGDPYFESVVLLLTADGTVGSTSFIDRSWSPKTVTNNLGVLVSDAQVKFGQSAFFDNSSWNLQSASKYLRLPVVKDLLFEGGDFTIEGWVYPTATPVATQYAGILAFRESTSSQSFSFLISGDGSGSLLFNVRIAGTTYSCNSALPVANVWTHVAAIRRGGFMQCFTNGVGGTAVAIQPGSLEVPSGLFPTIGLMNIGNLTSGNFRGYIDDLRVTKGVARYSENFTPPTTAYWYPTADPAPAPRDATPLRTPAPTPVAISEYPVPDWTINTADPTTINPFKGAATLTGTVKKLIPPSSTLSLRRRVRLYQSAGMKLLDMVASDAVTGEFVFENVIAGEDYTVVAEDHEGIYRSAIVNGVRGV
jgi:hypothetical protein